MPTAYIFILISLASMPAAIRSHDPIIIVGWVSQSFLQLVLLPIIMVGQKVSQDKIEHSHRLHAATHDKMDAIMRAIKEEAHKVRASITG